jgi:hypothetical protein
MSAPRALMARLQSEVERFNRNYPVGTPVRYWPTNDRRGGFVETTTRTEAYVLSGHTAVVFLAGRSGCVALTHVEPLAKPAEVSP